MFRKFWQELQEASRRGEYIKEVWPGTCADLPSTVNSRGCIVFRDDMIAGGVLGLAVAGIFAAAGIAWVLIAWPPDWMSVTLFMGMLAAAVWGLRIGVKAFAFRRALRWDPSTRKLAIESRGCDAPNIVECDAAEARAVVRQVWIFPQQRQIWLRFSKTFALFVYVREQFVVLGRRDRKEDLADMATQFTSATGIPVSEDDRFVVTG